MHALKRGGGRIAAAVMLVVLAACAGPRPAPPPAAAPPPDWAARRAALLALHDWALTGRVAVRAPQDSASGNVHWVQHGEAYQVMIFGPVGGALKLDGRGRSGVLRLPHETDRSGDIEALLQQRLGWRIPVTGLRYWARGLPIPQVPARMAFDGGGRLAWVEQYGWRVRYPDYTTADGLALPRRIDIERPDLRVKLLVDQWDLNVQ